MYVNAKKLAFLGLLLSFAVILVIFSGILEFNTLFLLVASSFCVGIAIRETGQRIGIGFYIASVLLAFILAPNKLYCITYAAMGLYLVVSEYTFHKLAYMKCFQNKRLIFHIIKYSLFNIMYLPILFLSPRLIYQGKLSAGLLTVFFIAGQIFLYIYDMAYGYFQARIWGKLRGHLHL